MKINEVMRAAGVGKVVASKCPKRQVGDEVEGTFGWQESVSLSTINSGDPAASYSCFKTDTGLVPQSIQSCFSMSELRPRPAMSR